MRKMLEITALLASVLLFLAGCGKKDSDGTMFRQDLGRTGLYQEAGIEKLNGEKWRFMTGYTVISSPVVKDGILYCGSMDRSLYAVDAATGQLKWRFETGGSKRWEFNAGSKVYSSPASFKGILYCGSQTGTLYALDLASGRLKWEFKTPREILSSPAVAGGLVYFGGMDRNFYALDAQTGKQKWVFRAGNEIASPAVVGKTIYFGCDDGSILALK